MAAALLLFLKITEHNWEQRTHVIVSPL